MKYAAAGNRTYTGDQDEILCNQMNAGRTEYRDPGRAAGPLGPGKQRPVRCHFIIRRVDKAKGKL